MGNNQRLMIFIVIGVFMISILGYSITLLGSGSSQSDDEISQELSEQAQAIEDAQAEQNAIVEKVNACRALAAPTGGGDGTLPEYDLPKGDVSELESIDLKVGTGKEAKEGDCVVAYYHGTLTDGTVFDSAYEREVPSRFSLHGVIEGWQLGVPGMKEGGVRQLNIPSELAYGEQGSAPLIGPDEDLVFVIELVEVVDI